MRTNTWLAILTVGQGLQVLQSQAHHADLKSQLQRMDSAQAERDQVRDKKFDRAAAIAQRGQFAMWIQSPEGQTFDRWSQHAVTASRQLEDRQAAWEFAWYAAHQAARETSPEATLTSFGASRPWDHYPWHRQLRGPQVHAVARQLDEFASSASEILPRPNELLPLTGVYFSHQPDEAERHTSLPQTVRELLKQFRADDELRVAALRADGFR